MKPFSILAVLLVTATSLYAGDPKGFAVWKNSSIQNASNELVSQVDEQKFAWKQLGTYGNHYLGISHREGDGTAELHEAQVDIWIVEGGEATLVLGGTIVDPKTVKPNEIRGSSIQGGSTTLLTAGDIVHIPVNVPHQLKIATGKNFTYTVIKVDSK